MPTPMTRPPSDRTLNEKPKKLITIIVMKMEIGMEEPTINEARQSPKKMNSTIMAKRTEYSIVCRTAVIELQISSLAS